MAVVVVAAACSAETTTQTVVPDPPEWRLSEDLRIDGYEADLVQITGVAVADDGTIALIQTQDHGIRFFGGDGTDLGLFGRDGAGPGEFGLIVSAGWLADTLWAFDMLQRRYTLVGKDLTFIRNLIPPGEASLEAADGVPARYGLNWWYGLYPDSGMLASIVESSAAVSSLDDTEVVLARLDLDGTVDRVLLRYDRGRSGITIRSGSGYSAVSIPYNNRPMFAAASDASALVLAGADVDGPEAGTFRVLVVDSSADTLFDRRYGFEIMPLPRSVIEEAIEQQATSMEERSPELAAALRRESDLPSVYPPLLGVLPGRDGSTWIRLRTDNDERRWLVLDETGEPIGQLLVDAGIGIAVADRTAVWTLESDSLGVRSLVRYRVVTN